MSLPFDLTTFEETFAGPDRTAKVSNRGGHVTFTNGWVVSIQFGAGTYSDNHHADFDAPVKPSRTAECAAWDTRSDGRPKLIELESDNVAGWQPIDHVHKALEAAARDDQPGIVAALTRDEVPA